MKTVFCWIEIVFIGIIALPVFAQSSFGPGPATGDGINRDYDDGYVYVDSTGDGGGVTSYWGYDNSSQVQGNVLVFHSESTLDANTIQMITDSYDISALFIFPHAPYAGTYSGGGLIIPDAPFSRSIEDIAVPEPSSFVILLLGVLVLVTFCRKWPETFLKSR